MDVSHKVAAVLCAVLNNVFANGGIVGEMRRDIPYIAFFARATR